MDRKKDFNVSDGRESLLQILAVMKDDEDFRRTYGSIPETINNRHETSVSLLCDMLVRMKGEAEIKKQCISKLTDVAEGWKLLQDDRDKLSGIIATLRSDKEELLQKVKNLEEDKEKQNKLIESLKNDRDRSTESRRRRQSRRQSSEMDQDEDVVVEKSDGAEWRVSSVINDFRKARLENRQREENETDSRSRSSDETFGTSRFQTSRLDTSSRNESMYESNYDGMSSQFGRMNYSTARLTNNPYEQLDSSYYNPTQFYQRQSSTFKRGGKRAPRGSTGSRGGRKKADTSDSSATTSTRGGKAGARSRKKSTKAVDVDLANDTSGIDLPNDSEHEKLSPSAAKQDDESPGKSYLDYISTSGFLDETE